MASNNPTLQFTIHGLDCAEEVAVLKREVGPLVGGEDNLGFDILNGRMTVTGTSVTADQVRDAVAQAGMTAELGAAGNDAVIETADIALMSDDLSKLPWLVRHSRRTLAVVRQNVVFSLGVKAVFVVLTLAGHSSMWAAVAADSGATLLVVFNALRLLRTTEREI